MTDTAMTTTTGALPQRTFVALSPSDVGPAQTQIADWCQAKILELAAELRDAQQNLRHAQASKWKVTPWQSLIVKYKRKMLYYSKIKKAVAEGYLIVPNFPVELIAVRVNRAAPATKAGDHYPNQINTALPDRNLPAGVGRYVDETNPHRDESYDRREPDGKGGFTEKRKRWTVVDSYDEEIDFPATLVKPEIMEATQRAMSLKLFDRIGIFHNGGTQSRKSIKSDPIVVGHIIDGSMGPRYSGDFPHFVTFFVAWWLDTRSL